MENPGLGINENWLIIPSIIILLEAIPSLRIFLSLRSHCANNDPCQMVRQRYLTGDVSIVELCLCRLRLSLRGRPPPGKQAEERRGLGVRFGAIRSVYGRTERHREGFYTLSTAALLEPRVDVSHLPFQRRGTHLKNHVSGRATCGPRG